MHREYIVVQEGAYLFVIFSFIPFICVNNGIPRTIFQDVFFPYFTLASGALKNFFKDC